MATVLLLLLPVFAGCIHADEPANPQKYITMKDPGLTSGDSITYLALGDSYTIGESVPESERWSVQLASRLNTQGIAVSKPDIIARTGWTTSELLTAIKSSGNTKTYAIVSLLIGVNNQYRKESIDVFRNELKTLLDVAKKYASGNTARVFVLSIPDWGVTPYAEGRDREAISREIDIFNKVVAETCEAAGILFIDITPLSRTALNDPSMIAHDNLHFSGKMYHQWALKALPLVSTMLR